MSGVHYHQRRAAGTGSLHIDVAGRTEVTDLSVSFLACVRCHGWPLLVEARQSRWEELLLSCCGSYVGPDSLTLEACLETKPTLHKPALLSSTT